MGVSLWRRGARGIRNGICSRSLGSPWSGGASPRLGTVSHGFSCWLNCTHLPLALAVLLSNFCSLLRSLNCSRMRRSKPFSQKRAWVWPAMGARPLIPAVPAGVMRDPAPPRSPCFPLYPPTIPAPPRMLMHVLSPPLVSQLPCRPHG